jgi:dienelactone hydrolase
MRRFFLAVFLLSMTLLAHAQALAPALSDADYVHRAEAFLAHLDHAEFDTALAQANAKMRESLPADKLAAVWTALPKQIGAAGPRGAAQLTREDGQRVVVVPLPFERMALQARITLEDGGAIAGFFIVPAPAAAPARLETNAHFTESEVRVGAADKSLGATLTLPVGSGPFPAVVLVHGSGPHDRDETLGPNKPFLDIAHGLAVQGVAVLRYEKRTSARPQDFAGHSYGIDDELVNDAMAAAELLQHTDHVDPARIFVIGHSLGAMMAPRMGQRAPWLAGLVLMAAPARPLQDIVPGQVRYIAALDGNIDEQEQKQIDTIEKQREEIRELDPAHPPTHSLMFNLPAAYWADLRAWDPIGVALTLKQPLLVLQGGRDYQVRPDSEFIRWQRSFAGNARVTLIEYPTLSHIFMTGSEPPRPRDYDRADHVDAKVISDIANWVAHIKP